MKTRPPPLSESRIRAFARVFPAALLILSGATESARADCNCLDTDLDGYPDVDGTCIARQVDQTSLSVGEQPPEPPAQISLTFDRDLVCGQYINGDYWVVEPEPGSGVRVVATRPAFGRTNDDAFGLRWKNGFQIDPVRVDAMEEPNPQGQSFDERITYWLGDGKQGRAGTSAPLPVRVSAGSSFIKAHSKPVWNGVPKSLDGTKGCQALQTKYGGPGGGAQACIRAYMVVTILAAAPANPSDSFRPPYSGKWDRSQNARGSWQKPGSGSKKPYRFADIRWEAFPKLVFGAAASESGYIANISDIRDFYRLPQIEFHPHNQQRRLKAFDSSTGGVLGHSDYAPDWANVSNRSWLRLTGDDVFPNPAEPGFDKVHKQAVVNLLQFGIDQLHLTIEGDKMYYPDGGHYAGGYLPALMACHLFDTPSPVGHDVTPECEWLARNKSEGSTVDVGYPMWGEQTYVYRNPLGLDQQQICSELLVRTGNDCPALGIDPLAAKPLYGQKFGQRAFNDVEKDQGGDISCLVSWSGSVSTHCRDPYQHIDHSGNACRPDPDQSNKNYERIVQPNIRHVALVARLYGIFRADSSGIFPNHIWDFAARRYWLGYETVPDLAPFGGAPTGYTGATGNRCAALHHDHACSETHECYPTNKEYPPTCWFCRALMDQFPTYVNGMGGTP